MDPLSQGVLGACAPQAFADKNKLLIAAVLGLLSGMSPDLDVLISSSEDPLLFLEYHRQFTHSLVFIPVGGLICACLFQLLFARRHLPFQQTYGFCTLGYATHGLLDSCTSYGTQLFWPFSSVRIAWHNISIIDPLFTLPILGLVVWACVSKRPTIARVACVWAVVYLCLGVVQRERAETIGYRLAAERGHTPLRLHAKPSMANLLLWKIVYETEDRFFVDAVRIVSSSETYAGESTLKLDVRRDFPWLVEGSAQSDDVARFSWFSSGYVAKDPMRPDMIIDVRYSIVPNSIDALWGIKLDPQAGVHQHADFENLRSTTPERRERFTAMLRGEPVL
jgi:inner membrane protein